jgi:hypothetical protein
VKWCGAQHGDIDCARRDAELIESSGSPERPEPITTTLVNDSTPRRSRHHPQCE